MAAYRYARAEGTACLTPRGEAAEMVALLERRWRVGDVHGFKVVYADLTRSDASRGHGSRGARTPWSHGLTRLPQRYSCRKSVIERAHGFVIDRLS